MIDETRPLQQMVKWSRRLDSIDKEEHVNIFLTLANDRNENFNEPRSTAGYYFEGRYGLAGYVIFNLIFDDRILALEALMTCEQSLNMYVMQYYSNKSSSAHGSMCIPLQMAFLIKQSKACALLLEYMTTPNATRKRLRHKHKLCRQFDATRVYCMIQMFENAYFRLK